ncbi:MAG: VWA domain-containing protein, partial [Planctomycetes bacterium]|nr:VWA domain-containing protein [Planctomycetota bacterium]
MPHISFAYPQLFICLLLLPLAWRWLTNRRLAVSTILRLALAVLGLAIIAGPTISHRDPGTDIIILIDRSSSCADQAARVADELIPLIRSDSGEGDRLAILGFAEEVAVERGFAGDAGLAHQDDDPDGSALAAALEQAGRIRSPARRTAVLCISDGMYTGPDPARPQTVQAAASMPFWYRRVGGNAGLDAAALRIDVPAGATPRSAWLVHCHVYASAPCRAEYSLSRNNQVISSGPIDLKYGHNRFSIRDSADSGDYQIYTLTIAAPGDSKQENNAAAAMLAMDNPPKTLLAGAGGGIVASALTSAAIPVEQIRVERFPTDPALLAPYNLVVLENCRLSDMPAGGPEALAQAVESGLVSLLVTGGKNSFGAGGYHRSPLDPLLPVEMEIRSSTRRGALAVAIALDRSGAMGVAVGRNRTKMDLA